MSNFTFEVIELIADQPEKFAVLKVDRATQTESRIEGIVVALCETWGEAVGRQRDFNEGQSKPGGGVQ
jgi:hypothetical protein